MSKHDHVPPPPACEHTALKFCRQCDAVECSICGKEWRAASVGQANAFREYANQRIWPKQEPYPEIRLTADPVALGSPVGRVTFSQCGAPLMTARPHVILEDPLSSPQDLGPFDEVKLYVNGTPCAVLSGEKWTITDGDVLGNDDLKDTLWGVIWGQAK